jgi:prepilin-type N-terminal cleavage/methylation domain-containing protein
MARDLPAHAHGFTLLELLLAVAVAAVLASISIPLTSDTIDEVRTKMAARYLEGRIMDARMHAVRRSTALALRFEPVDDDYQFAEYVDGNGNGIRTIDITAGLDVQLAPRQRLRDSFPGVVFGLRAGVPDVDGVRSSAPGDGVRIGTSRILTVGPDGTATSGTLYLRGRRGQYAVRILGATGRTRVLQYEPGTGQWTVR